MKMTVAILWTIVLITCILNMANGGQPTWSNVFLPLICLIIRDWIEVIEDYC